MSERALIDATLIRATAAGCRLFRNNCGQLQDIRGKWVRYGVCNPGGSDLIGWAPGGRFLAVEVKAGRTRTTEAQENFIRAVNANGGIAEIIRELKDFDRVIDRIICTM